MTLDSSTRVRAVIEDLLVRIAGESIANDWLKTIEAGPKVPLHYDLAGLFTSTNVVATSWNYGTHVSIDGYSRIFCFVKVNTPNGVAYWAYFYIRPEGTLTTAMTVKYATDVADNAIFSSDNVDANGDTVLGAYAHIDVYNPDSGTATITDAHMVCLP